MFSGRFFGPLPHPLPRFAGEGMGVKEFSGVFGSFAAENT
jgi:hypothetical protein